MSKILSSPGQRQGNVGTIERRQRRGMPLPDLATILGLLVGFGLISASTVLGGSAHSFFDLRAVFIVLGGTFAVTTISYSLSDVLRAQGVLFSTLFRHGEHPPEAAHRAMRLALMARQNGILTLQNQLGSGNRFLQKALMLVADGVPANEMEPILQREMNAIIQRHVNGAGVLRKAAETAPAMGLIGTLVGLVQMLGNLDDPSKIGPGMAVALLTTFYGAILSTMVFAPLAAKLERNAGEERLVNSIYLMASASIARQENPRRLELVLNTVLPPDNQISYFD